jgi:hypothetical protein
MIQNINQSLFPPFSYLTSTSLLVTFPSRLWFIYYCVLFLGDENAWHLTKSYKIKILGLVGLIFEYFQKVVGVSRLNFQFNTL